MADKQIALIDDILSRGVAEFIDPDNQFRNKLISKAKGEHKPDIVVKFGVDPTRPDIHLGHAVIFRKLRQLQDLGCKVIFLVGDFTAGIGDPSGKSKVRPEVAGAEIEENLKSFLTQIDKIIKVEQETLPNGSKRFKDTPNFSWIRNSDWYYSMTDLIFPPEARVKMEIKNQSGSQTLEFGPDTLFGRAALFVDSRMQKKHLNKNTFEVITLRGFLWTLRRITHARLIERDMFRERFDRGEELYLHEMMYPVLQGIDSHVLAKIYNSCDLEIGGNDQTFNMLIGRDVMKANKQEPQSVLALKLLEGTDGKEKMSKSLDNYIAITDSPDDMFGKTMSIPDSSITNYFELCTYAPVADIENIKKQLAGSKTNPKDLKIRLAREIVAIYHGESKALEAEKDFAKTFTNKQIPTNIPEVTTEAETPLVDVVLAQEIVSSKTEWRRLIEEGAVTDLDNDKKITEADHKVGGTTTLKIGKHRFLKIKTK